MADQNVYEMLWDCKFCGTKKLLGKTHRFCPVCGAAQDPATRYYPSDDEKVAVKDHVFVGADKICPACSSTNSGNAEFCTQCGSSLEKATAAGTLGEQRHAQGAKFESSGARDLAKERLDADLGRAKQKEHAPKSAARRPFIYGGIIVVIVAIIGVAAFLLSTHQTNLIVSGHSWERVINVDSYGPVSGSDWRNNVPSGAYNVSCSREVRSYNQVPDGQTCQTVRKDQGDGTFREEQQCTTKYRKDPVYDDKCSYTVNRWSAERTATAKGDSVKDTVAWPDPQLKCANQQNLGCERESGRTEKYILHLKDTKDNKTYDCEFDQAKWQSIGDETTWQMEIRRVGTPLCDTLKST
jgi:hypothetical protein